MENKKKSMPLIYDKKNELNGHSRNQSMGNINFNNFLIDYKTKDQTRYSFIDNNNEPSNH
jgi:hypothetical protein